MIVPTKPEPNWGESTLVDALVLDSAGKKMDGEKTEHEGSRARATHHKKSQNVLLRVDASPTIGLGHLLRQLALGEGLREHKIIPRFVLGAEAAPFAPLVEERGFLTHVLSAASGGVDDLLAVCELGE